MEERIVVCRIGGICSSGDANGLDLYQHQHSEDILRFTPDSLPEKVRRKQSHVLRC